MSYDYIMENETAVTTLSPFRALCQELMDAIDSGIPCGRIKQSPLAVRVDAALAQPEPQGAPTDDELHQLLFDDHRSAIEFACDSEGEGNIIIRNHIAFARAVLARYGSGASFEQIADVIEEHL
jgi:hypothetical protein